MKISSLATILCLMLSSFLLAKPIVPPEFDTPDKKLLFATVHNDVELARQALRSGAKLEAEFRGGESYTPLQVCAILGNLEVAEVLLKQGASLERPEGFDNSAVEVAAENNQIQMLKFLVTYADRLGPIRASLYESAFERAVKNGHLEAVKLLVEVGIDPVRGVYRHARNPALDEGTYLGLFSLNHAAEHGDPEVIRFLLNECGLDANRNYEGRGKYPLWIAVSRGNIEAARALIEKGADVNATEHGNPSELSCLAIAMYRGYLDCVDLLLKHGAKVISTDPRTNPTQLADYQGFDAYVGRLTKMGGESNLWAYWAELAKTTQTSTDELETKPVGGLAAHLIEGDWKISPNETEPNTDSPHCVAILGDADTLEFADLLFAEMAGIDGVEFVERNELERIIREHRLDRAGLLKYQKLQDFSRMIAADSLFLISTVVLEKTRIYRLQWLDVKRGLVLNERYVSADSNEWSEFNKLYTDFVRQSLQTQNKGRRIPVSLMGVNANWASPEGRHLEKDLFYVIQHALSKQSGLLLLDRKSLQRLVSEKRIGGTEEDSFQATGLFINVRVDVDLSSGAVQKLVLNAAKPEQAASEDLSFEVPTGERTLTADSMKIVQRFVDTLASNRDSEETGVAVSNSMEADRDALVNEAYWLYRNRMYQEAQSAIENASALGLRRVGAWKLYLRILEDSIPELCSETKSNDANNRKIIELEHDRLWVIENYIKTSKKGGRDQLERQISLSERTLLQGFSYSLFRMRSVTMKHRYRDELIELENHFVRLFDQVIKPLREQEPADNTLVPLLMTAFETLPNLNFISLSEHERLVRDSISGQHHYISENQMYPRSVKGALKQWYEWVRKYGTPRFIAAFYGEPEYGDAGKYMNYDHGGEREMVMPSRHHTERYQAELLKSLETSDSPDANFELAKLRIDHTPRSLRDGFAISQTRSITLAGQKLHAAKYVARMQNTSKRYPAHTSKSTLRDYTSVSLLQEMQKANHLAFKREIKANEKERAEYVQRTINFIEERIKELSTSTEKTPAELPFVDAYIWDMSAIDPKQKAEFELWRAGQLNSFLFHAENALWTFGKFGRNSRKIWISRMDQESRKTSYQTFMLPEEVNPRNLSKSFILISDQKMIFGGGDTSPTIVLDRKTLSTSVVTDFIPQSASSGSYPCAHLHDGDLYYTALPVKRLIANRHKAVQSELVFLKMELDTMQHTVIFNFRRKPAETLLDHPLNELKWRTAFTLYYHKEKGVFLFFHNHNKYVYDPETEKFTELSDLEFNSLEKGAVWDFDGWRPDPEDDTIWTRPNGSRGSGIRIDGGVSFALFNLRARETRAIGVRLKPLAGVSHTTLNEVEIRIQKVHYELQTASEKYSTFFFRSPAKFFIIENDQLSQAIKKGTPIEE